MSSDHKPNNPEEYARIIAANGTVSPDGRINGNINLSRSLGDFEYKRNDALPPEQ
jgi:serine/threonine protein phosphatase PrpC